MTATTDPIQPQTTMRDVLAIYPGAQRALFRRYHIGGCSSCAFQPEETLEALCRRNDNLDVREVIEHLRTSHEQDEQMQMSPEELASLRGQGQVKLLDIRSRDEWDAVRIEGSVRMSQETMQEILGRWGREDVLVIYDHHGEQSMDAAAYFIGQGFKNVRCLKGGIDAWAQEVEPDMPRYVLQ